MEDGEALTRRLSATTLGLHGVGVIIGAGIYVLVGEIARYVGNGLWLAFTGAAVAALPTALCYASLTSRHPRSAGEAVFVDRAFGRPWLSFAVGYLVLASGVASTAAVSHGFTRYFLELVPLPEAASPLLAIAFLGALSWINHRGLEEATWVNTVCVVLSVGALLVLVVAALPTWGSVDLLSVGPVGPGRGDLPSGGFAAVLSASALAFYAYVGFEDMCNVAEEVKHPERAMPRAILGAMAVATVIYVAVGVTVVSAIPVAELVESEVPLARVWEAVLPGVPVWVLAVVALFAVTNTALFNMIMASRILWGMSRHGWISPVFGRLHSQQKTPTAGVIAVFVLAAGTSVTGVLSVLAEATNIIILMVFFAVCLALLVSRLKGVPSDDPAKAGFEIPLLVPIVGMAIDGYLVAQFSPGAYLRAGSLLVVGLVLYALGRRR